MRQSSAGFSLIEMLVASLLMASLIIMLSMLFQQSSIAWRTGISRAKGYTIVRRTISEKQREAIALMPLADGRYGKFKSIWSKDEGKRAFETANEMGNITRYSGSDRPAFAELSGSARSQSAETYSVGVGSAGPDGKWDTDDDIVTWPKNKAGN